MTRTLQALFLALGDLSHRHVLRILLQSLALTLLLLAMVGAALYVGADWMIGRRPDMMIFGTSVAGILATIFMILIGWLAFRGIAIAVIGLFADDIVADVERRHYPDAAARAVAVGWRKNIRLGLASIGRLIGGNLLALPAYILLLVTGIGLPLLALFVNGLLLGRDLEAMILARHPDLPRLSRTTRWSLGLLSAVTFLVPIANLLAPMLGAAMAVHIIHLRGSDTARARPPAMKHQLP